MGTSNTRRPLNPIVLVEGKYDEGFVSRALRLISPSSTICVRYLEQLEDGATGGVDHMLRYIKTNAGAVRMRAKDAPVIVLLDWDSEKKKTDFCSPSSRRNRSMCLFGPTLPST